MMAGISDKAVKTNYSENKFKFNAGSELQNKEFSDGSGLEWYDAMHRMYDPQLGRFFQLDPIAPFLEDWSPYVFCFDNPVSFTDESGLAADSASSKPAHHHHKPKVQTLPTVTVVGYKKDCKTCGKSPSVNLGPPPPVKPPGIVIDNVNSGTKNLKQEAEDKYEMVKSAFETGSTATDWLEKLSSIGGNERAANIFGKVGAGLTIVNVGFDLHDKDYLNAGVDALSLIPRANPYVFTYQTAKALLNSTFVLSGAALDAQETMEEYLIRGHNANVEGNEEKAKEYFQEAAHYEKIRNSLIGDLRAKTKHE